ncbi:unnamed protein product [Thelazia callipaeda]|uniref:Origin recognition complex subunit 4 n=1 Tax=Thelazia callipaeda TaxID=103827 RepID=A0A0N5CYM6_THECL|nr:unnamed protein product [Thelazia callipaeda]
MAGKSVFCDLLAELDYKFCGLDHCISKLHEIIKHFVTSKKGGSAVVSGPKSSGKRSVISKIVMNYVDWMEIIFIDGLIQASEASALKTLQTPDNNSKQLKFVVVFNFDHFIRGRQIFLYTLLNSSLSGPLFALCVTSCQNHMELLEKRVRSRLSSSCISFAQPCLSFNDFSKAFISFLYINMNEYEGHNRLIKAFVEDTSIQCKLHEIYNETRSYCILKQITATFFCFMDAEHISSISNPQALRIFREAKSAVVADEDTMKSIILGLTLRQLCLLLCCVRLVRNKRRQDFTFREIILDYRKMVNIYLPMLNVKDELILLKELDTLCCLTALEERDEGGQLLFRRTSLQALVDIDFVLNCLKDFTPLPTVIMQWLDDLER